MKSIDYLKLVSTASKRRRSAPLSAHDKALWGAIAYGAIVTFVLVAAVAVAASMLGEEIDSELIEFLLAGLFVSVVYMSVFAWLSVRFPRASRLLIGVPMLVVISLLTKASLFDGYRHWYMLLPICLYLLIVTLLVFRQFSLLIATEEDHPGYVALNASHRRRHPSGDT